MLDHSDEKLEAALSKLTALDRDAEGVQEVVAVGKRAIPGLRSILFQREPSGLYQVRCRAVEALGQLKAFDVLKEFLRGKEPAADPVERLGDDVVLSSAARWLAWSRDRGTFSFLLDLATRHPLNGLIAALASFRRPEAIPVLVDALGEDELRRTAEIAILSYGSGAGQILLEAADHFRSIENPSESEFRKLRSIMSLLGEIDLKAMDADRNRHFMTSGDVQVSLLACGAALRNSSETTRAEARAKLLEIRPHVSWLEKLQIDGYLTKSSS